MTIVGIARHGSRADHKTFFQCRHDRHLHAELVRGTGLAFGNAFHFGRMQRIQLVLVLALLSQDTTSPGEQVFERLALLQRDLVQLTCDVAVNAPHSRAQGTQGRTHAPELFGMGIAADLLCQPGRFTVVVLAQMQAALPCCFYQVFTTAFQQCGIGRIGNCLLHDRRIDNHPFNTRWPDHLGPLSGLNALCQQFFHADFAQALAPARQA